MKISSDLGTAQQKATAIAHALEVISGIGTPEIDTQTTVQGNSHAQDAIQVAIDAGTQISEAVQLAVNNLQSVAKNFEAVDQTIKESIIDPLGGGK